MKKRGLAISLAVVLCFSTVALAFADSETSASAAAAAIPSFGPTASGDFTDTTNHWAKDSISTAVANGWFQGTSTTTFSPDASLNRSMFITALGRMADAGTSAKQTVFTDVSANDYAAPYVAWAYQNKITSGTTATTFSPGNAVTREQLATMLYNYSKSKNVKLPTGTSVHFSDAAQISTWATDAVNALTAAGIVSGKEENRFVPAGIATRAEAASMLVRYDAAITGDTSSGEHITTNGGGSLALSTLKHQDASAATQVFYTSDISSDALMKIYAALKWTPTGKVAVKLSTGEPPNSNYLRPELIKNLVQSVNGTIVENNTAYGGSRTETAMHMQVAKDHGYTAIANVDILDADGSMSLPVTGGTRLKEDLVGSHFANYDSYLVLSHFKGHAMAGFGGAIKNISIGMGSKEGKCLIHTSGASHTSPWNGDQDSFLESMGEAGKAVSHSLGNGKRIVYINVMNRLSVDCDCDGNPAEPDMHDIGILASTDPVALDQACIDLVYASPNRTSLVQRIGSRNGLHVLEHAAEIGLGSRTYHLVDIDGQK